MSLALADIDGDGALDLYIANYRRPRSGINREQILGLTSSMATGRCFSQWTANHHTGVGRPVHLPRQVASPSMAKPAPCETMEREILFGVIYGRNVSG
jgi:hypothetical protein